MRRSATSPAGLILFLAILIPSGLVHAEEAKKVITEGSKVSLEYTLNVEGGEVVDSNSSDDPLVYTQGKEEIIPALEDELSGLAAGDEKEVTLQPDEAYGPVDPNAFQEVPLDQIPEDARKKGQLLIMEDQQGHRQHKKDRAFLHRVLSRCSHLGLSGVRNIRVRRRRAGAS